MDKIQINSAAPNILCICIDSVNNREGKGRLYHCYSRKAVQFENEFQLIAKMDGLFEKINYPQAAMKSRQFIEKENTRTQEAVRVMDKDEVINQTGEQATFIVHVQYRQNATWQGQVVWAEKKITKNFRSALELLKLIDNALDESGIEEE